MSCWTTAFHSSEVGVMGRAGESCSFLVVCCSSREMNRQRLRQRLLSLRMMIVSCSCLGCDALRATWSLMAGC